MLRRHHTLPVSLLLATLADSKNHRDHPHKTLTNIMLSTAHEIACSVGTMAESGTRPAKSRGVRWGQKNSWIRIKVSGHKDGTSRSNWLKRLELTGKRDKVMSGAMKTMRPFVLGAALFALTTNDASAQDVLIYGTAQGCFGLGCERTDDGRDRDAIFGGEMHSLP